jgi:hypothetical protein
LRAFSAPSRKLKSTLPRSGPRPGCVEMSMKLWPALWFSAANMAVENRIDRICDFGGSLPPRNPSMRMVAPGPAMSFSTCSISSGSSGSASICSRDSTLLNRSLFGSDAAAAGSRPTATLSATFSIGSVISRRLSPGRTRTSLNVELSNPGKLALTAYRPAGTFGAVATPWPSDAIAGITTSRLAVSVPLRTTVAFGITAPLGSLTTTRSVPV